MWVSHRLGNTLSPTYLCFMGGAEAHISLSKLPFQILNQTVSADEGLEVKQGDSEGSHTENVPKNVLPPQTCWKSDFTISTTDLTFFSPLYFHRFFSLAKSVCNFQLQDRIVIPNQNLL